MKHRRKVWRKWMAGIYRSISPMIRTRREMLEVIFEDERLSDMYLGWSEEQRLEEFLSLVLGQQVKILRLFPTTLPGSRTRVPWW